MAVEVFDNVLPYGYAVDLYHECNRILKSPDYVWKTNYSWPDMIVNVSHPVMVRELDADNKNRVLDYLMAKGVIQDKDFYVMNYMWTKLSYIPWHDDHHVKRAMTLYLNPEWQDDWGGMYLYANPGATYKNVGNFQGFIPKFNTVVRNDNQTLHHVTPTSLDAPVPRCTLQFFSST
jgi:hypothetical protein